MDQLNCTTKTGRGKHLSFEERVIIQTRCKDGWNPNQIAKELGRPSNTVRNEIRLQQTNPVLLSHRFEWNSMPPF